MDQGSLTKARLDGDSLDAGLVEHLLRGQIGHLVDECGSEGAWSVDISTGASMFSCKVQRQNSNDQKK